MRRFGARVAVGLALVAAMLAAAAGAAGVGGAAAAPAAGEVRVVPPADSTRPAGGYFVTGTFAQRQHTFGLDPRFAVIPAALLVLAAIFGVLTLRDARRRARHASMYR